MKLGETTSVTGNITVQSDTDLTADRLITAKRGSVTLDAQGELAIQTTVSAYRDITLSGASVSNGPAELKTTVGDITISATAGDITFTDEDSVIESGSNRYFFTAANDITIENAIQTAIIDSKFQAGHDVNLTTDYTIVSSIINAGMDATVETASYMTDVTIDANGDVKVEAFTISGLTVDTGFDANVTARNDIVNSNIRTWYGAVMLPARTP